MVGQKMLNAYRTMEKQAEMPPEKLIHMLYERVLVHLDLAAEGIRAHAPSKCGENLGKAIAIITELLASVDSKDQSDAAGFLRNLYGAILMELPKVSGNQDVKILRQARAYIERLKGIWEETAMREAAIKTAEIKQAMGENVETAEPVVSAAIQGYSSRGHKRADYDAPQPQVAMGGVSVSI